ncbi:E3 ubiquitin-protein ligase TRIM33-like [Ruditapes philippinarum]|uniref:E3 ubiquitin-protein ligase TRIM33-like n=1 Tax=Ruditapes philippinarum TaxID=129788 RepID=UPI00295AC8CC|nr:E3 ubiquitin-protein ligase TRIM33-like [Ruditapes philippinarum]
MNACLDSDEIVEIFCEKCPGGVKPPYFCVDCVCLLCRSCKVHHDFYFKDHVFEQKNNIPSDLYRMKCSKHVPSVTKFYCLRCDKFACATCVQCEHSLCSGMVKSVYSLSRGLHDSREFKEFLKRINDADVKLEEIEDTNTNIWSEIDIYKDKARNEIEQWRDAIILKVQSLSNELCESIEFEASTYRAKALTVEMEQSKLKEDVKATKKDLVRKISSRENCLLFKILKEQDMDNVENAVLALERNHSAFRYTFQPSENIEKIKSILKGTTSFGSLKATGCKGSIREKLSDGLKYLLSPRK